MSEVTLALSPMANETLFPHDLLNVTQSLAEQFQLLHLPSRKIPVTEWDAVPPQIRELVPQWLADLLANYNLAGPVLERQHEFYKWNRNFSFWPPAYYAERISFDDCIMKEEIIDAGLIPLSDAGNGDLWLIKIADGPTSPVYLFDLSGMEKKLINDNLAFFLKSLKISRT
jgi:hypothetical protein